MRITVTGEPKESKRLVLEVIISLLGALPLNDMVKEISGVGEPFIKISLSREDEAMLADFLEMRKSQRKN